MFIPFGFTYDKSGPNTGTKIPASRRAPIFSFWKSSVDRSMNEQVDELMHEERILEHARNDGRQNLPKPDASEPAVTEQRVTERVTLNLKSICEALKKAVRERAVVVSGLSVAAPLMRLKEMPSAASFEIKRLLGDSRDELVRAKIEARQRERDLRHFQRVHNLHRAPSYPGETVKPWLWFFLGVLGLIEAALNAHFWGPVNEYGLIGGFFKAAFIALLNLVPAVLTGLYIVPKLAHRLGAKRAYAWPLLVTWVGWTGFYNLFVGHWRVTAETGTGTESMQAAATSMLAQPIAGLLANGDAVMLVIAGVIAALVAAVDAFAMDDRYWGYGVVGRLHEKAQRTFDDLKKRLRGQISEIVGRYSNEATNIVADLPNDVRQINALINDAARIREEANNSAEVQQSVLDTVLKSYRDENRRVRTAPVPAYFSTYLILDRPDFDQILGAMLGERQRFIEEVGQINPAAESVKTDLLRMAEEQLDALVQFVESIEAETLRQLNEQRPVTNLPANLE